MQLVNQSLLPIDSINIRNFNDVIILKSYYQTYVDIAVDSAVSVKKEALLLKLLDKTDLIITDSLRPKEIELDDLNFFKQRKVYLHYMRAMIAQRDSHFRVAVAPLTAALNYLKTIMSESNDESWVSTYLTIVQSYAEIYKKLDYNKDETQKLTDYQELSLNLIDTILHKVSIKADVR
jgi:hypothetical protein